MFMSGSFSVVNVEDAATEGFYYAPHPLGGAWSNDAVWCLSVWRLSFTSSLSREQRGLGRLKFAKR